MMTGDGGRESGGMWDEIGGGGVGGGVSIVLDQSEPVLGEQRVICNVVT